MFSFSGHGQTETDKYAKGCYCEYGTREKESRYPLQVLMKHDLL